MPDRIIPESALMSRKLALLSAFQERLFWRLITLADDYGRFDPSPAVVKQECLSGVSFAGVRRIAKALEQFERLDLIEYYSERRRAYFTKWDKYQRQRPRTVCIIVGREFSRGWQSLRLQVFARDGYRCVYCGVAVERPDCDHVVPVFRGGKDEISNLVTACGACNRSKGARAVDEWRRERGL